MKLFHAVASVVAIIILITSEVDMQNDLLISPRRKLDQPLATDVIIPLFTMIYHICLT